MNETLQYAEILLSLFVRFDPLIVCGDDTLSVSDVKDHSGSEIMLLP